MREIVPGIFQISLPLTNPDLANVNIYLVRGDSGCLLVDTGMNTTESFNLLKEGLGEIGVSFEDISRVVITHVHIDHYGMAGRLKQLSPTEVLFHQREIDFVESRYINMESLLSQVEGWLHSNGVPESELSQMRTASVELARFAVPIPPDVTLHGGETITQDSFQFRVLWTPGHSAGHIALYEPGRKVLISGLGMRSCVSGLSSVNQTRKPA